MQKWGEGWAGRRTLFFSEITLKTARKIKALCLSFSDSS
jgi:hypothetical protein